MKNKSDIWRLPNLITLSRILVIPLIIILLYEDLENEVTSTIAFFIFIFSAFSDLIDGVLARKMNIVSTFGAFMDPLADKLLVLTTMIMLIPLGRIPAWMVTLFLAREITITGLRAIAADKGIIISASLGGKYKTSFQIIALGFLILHYPTFGINLHPVGFILLWFALFFSLWSGWEYIKDFWQEVERADIESRVREVGKVKEEDRANPVKERPSAPARR